MLGHSFWQPDAAMGRRIGRDEALVHRVAASKKHGVWHSCPVEMCSGWPAILARVDVGLHYVARLVNVVAKDGRDMVYALGHNVVIPRRSRKAALAGGDGRFSYQFLASIKVGLLFAKMDKDSRRARAALVIPPAGRCRLLHSGRQLRATTEKDRKRGRGRSLASWINFMKRGKYAASFDALK